MSKLPTTARRSTNLLLDYISAHLRVGDPLPTETKMAEAGKASRTAIRTALGHFIERGLIGGMKDRYLLRTPTAADYFDVAALHSGTENLQQILMERIYERDLPPGATFTEAELARAAGVSTIAVREFLIGFSRYGLIEKHPRHGWHLCAFEPGYAEELAQARELFELMAIERLAGLSPEHPAFDTLADLLARHEAQAHCDVDSHTEFPALDREFHTFMIGLLRNRFAEQLNDAVSMVFHYHYQWDKRNEMQRNREAVREHLDILRALVGGDIPAAMKAMRTHLRSARSTMLEAVSQGGGSPA